MPKLLKHRRYSPNTSLQVTDIASPLFKVDWPGAPQIQYGSKGDMHGAPEVAYKQQDEVSRAPSLWPNNSRPTRFAASTSGASMTWLPIAQPSTRSYAPPPKSSVNRVSSSSLKTNCLQHCHRSRSSKSLKPSSPLTSLSTGTQETPSCAANSTRSRRLGCSPEKSNHHCHCKNAIKDASGKIVWSPVDKGYVDWTAQFRALKQAGYRDAVSLETHWRGAATPEASTRISWDGMKQALINSGTF